MVNKTDKMATPMDVNQQSSDKMLSKERLEAAYGTMLSRVKEQMDELSKRAEPVMSDFFAKAKQKAIQLGELTEKEAEQIEEYVQRDLQEAAVFMEDAKKALSDWIYFDYKVIEESFWETYKAVAAQVKLEWVEFNQRLKHAKEYNVGEIIGMGTLECVNCKETSNYNKSSTIAKCPQCGCDKFVRK